MARRLSEDELQAIVANQIELAKTHDRTTRQVPREKALDYFLGNMNSYVPPEANRSKVVSRDVADTISRMLPGIMRVFTASDRMAIAEPTGTEDIDFAKQATDGLNYVFMKDNDGYQIIYNATWDALLNGNGIVQTWYDDTPVYSTSFHSGLTEDQYTLLIKPQDGTEPPEGEEDDRVEVLAGPTQDGTKTVDDGMGGAMQVPTYSIRIKRKKLSGTFVIDCIPPEDFLVHADAIDLDESPFNDHWQRKTRSDLVAMGYSKDDVWAIPIASRNDTAEAIARLNSGNDSEATDKSMELVDYHECFIRIDVDGDGEAELVRACHGGATNGKLLDWEVWEDEDPFDDIKCEPIPHRLVARSMTDNAIDVQDVNTVLTRQLLNNVYWAMNPQRFVTGKIKNPDQLDTPTFGGSIIGETGSTVENLTIDNVGDIALQGIQYMQEVLVRRTGVSQQTMSLDPDALQNETAESVRDRKDSSYGQTEIIARNMASGWSKVFRKLMRLMVKHQDYARKIMFNGKEVVIDPRYWNADMNVTINVGLGTGSRDRDLGMLQTVLQSQLMLADRFIGLGAMDDAIALLPKILMTMTKMGEAAGIKNPEDFYPEYTEEKVQKLKELAAQKAAAPDPALALEEAKGKVQMELKQVDAQVATQIEAGKIEAGAQAEELKAQGNAVKEEAQMRADLQVKDAELRNQVTIEQIKTASAERLKMAELELKREEMAQARELEIMKLNAVEVEEEGGPGPDGKKPTKKRVMDGNSAILQSINTLATIMSAPVEIIRDPQTGKAVGTRKVVN